MIDSWSWPKLKPLVAAATACLKAIEERNKAEARLADIRAENERRPAERTK